MQTTTLLPLLLAVLGCSTTNLVPESRHLIADEEQLIRSLDDQERRAVLTRDVERLQNLWSPEFTVNSPSNRVVTGRSAVIALHQQGIIHYSSFERAVESVRMGNHVAVVMGAETVKPIGSAPLAGRTVQRRFTNIWKKDAGTWRLWARHANVVDAR